MVLCSDDKRITVICDSQELMSRKLCDIDLGFDEIPQELPVLHHLVLGYMLFFLPPEVFRTERIEPIYQLHFYRIASSKTEAPWVLKGKTEYSHKIGHLRHYITSRSSGRGVLCRCFVPSTRFFLIHYHVLLPGAAPLSLLLYNAASKSSAHHLNAMLSPSYRLLAYRSPCSHSGCTAFPYSFDLRFHFRRRRCTTSASSEPESRLAVLFLGILSILS